MNYKFYCIIFLLFLIFFLLNNIKNNNEYFNNRKKKNIIIYTIPKSGTHFVSDIICLMINKNINIHNKNDMYKIINHRPKKNLKRLKYNIFSEHIRGLSRKDLNNSKLILTIRNPIDLCISGYYYYEKRNKNSKVSIYSYIKKNILKACNDCNYQIRLKRNYKNSILIRYEDIILNKRNTINILYNFFKNDLNLKKINKDLIIQKTDINKMKNKEKNGYRYKVGKIQPYLFHRNGSFGQWNKELTKRQYLTILNMIPKNIKKFYKDIFNYNYLKK